MYFAGKLMSQFADLWNQPFLPTCVYNTMNASNNKAHHPSSYLADAKDN